MDKTAFPVIGGSEIVDSLGSGGMGDVYRAVQTATDREVAIKQPKSEIAQALEKFTTEINFAAQVQHEFVVPIYHGNNEEEQDQPRYLAMRLILGPEGTPKNADQLVIEAAERNHRTVKSDYFKDLVTSFRGLAAAVQAVHDAGIIHRDIKPANLLIDEFGDFHLTDFGLAVLLSNSEAGSAGTSFYIAPELLEGASATPQSDIYSLGVTMAMLFGTADMEVLAGQLQSIGGIAEVFQSDGSSHTDARRTTADH